MPSVEGEFYRKTTQGILDEIDAAIEGKKARIGSLNNQVRELMELRKLLIGEKAEAARAIELLFNWRLTND